MKLMYTAKVEVEGGREGKAKSDDGLLSVSMAMPKALGGSGNGTNPEQLFAAGFAACFEGAMGVVARGKKVDIKGTKINSEASLYAPEGGGFQLGVMMKVNIPGLDQKTAEEVVAEAHQVCPYSKATRGNIQVEFQVKGGKA